MRITVIVARLSSGSVPGFARVMGGTPGAAGAIRHTGYMNNQ